MGNRYQNQEKSTKKNRFEILLETCTRNRQFLNFSLLLSYFVITLFLKVNGLTGRLMPIIFLSPTFLSPLRNFC